MGKIELTPSELLSQSNELSSLAERYESLFSNVSSVLNNVNTGWSEILSNNFEGKILSAQKRFSGIVNALNQGANVANTSATSFENVDSLLAKNILEGGTVVGAAAASVVVGEKSAEEAIIEALNEYLQMQEGQYEKAQEVADFIRKYYDMLPDEIKEQLDTGDLEFVLDLFEQDFDDWMSLDVDPAIVEKIALLCGQEDIYAKGLAKIYDMVVHPQGRWGEIRTTCDSLVDEATRLGNQGNYLEAIKTFGEACAIGCFGVLYGPFEVLSEVTADIAEGIYSPIMKVMDCVTDIIPGNIDDLIVDGINKKNDFEINLLRCLL